MADEEEEEFEMADEEGKPRETEGDVALEGMQALGFVR